MPFTAFTVIRLQHLTLPTVGQGSNWSPCPPEEFVTTLFPLVRQAETHLVEMLAVWASTKRVWKLARPIRQGQEPRARQAPPARQRSAPQGPAGRPVAQRIRQQLSPERAMAAPVAPSSMDPRSEARWQKVRRVVTANRALFQQQGSVVQGRARGRPIWSLRFVESGPHGRSVQRAIYLGGDPQLVQRVRALLDECRAAGARRREAAELARLVALSRGLVRQAERMRPMGPGSL